MVSKNDLAVGVLVLIAGIVIYMFSPAGALYMKVNPTDPATIVAHNNTHYAGGVLAIIFGLVGVALYKKVNKVTLAVSALSIILGLVFSLFGAGGPLFSVMQPHGVAMMSVGGFEAVLGLVAIVGSAVLKSK